MVADLQNSARKVPMQHMSNLVRAAAGNPVDPPRLSPDQMQLYSYYVPGLTAGNYAIEAEQQITATDLPKEPRKQTYHVYNWRKKDAVGNRRPLPDRNRFDQNPSIAFQDFEVVTPQFSIDPKLINSYYPPDGHLDEGRILPHICFEDVHLPWERNPNPSSEQLVDPDFGFRAGEKLWLNNGNVVQNEADAGKRNAHPWLALMVFDFEDLPPLRDSEFAALGPGNGKLPEWVPRDTLSQQPDLSKQSSNGTFQMKVGDYFKIPKEKRVNFEAAGASLGNFSLPSNSNEAAPPRSQERMTAIFPTVATFKKLFSHVDGFRFAAHVRNINTTGFPDAGIDQLGLYSIIVSTRTGRFDQDAPKTQIVHLVSVEHFQTTIKHLSTNDNDRIGLISLFSWTYNVLPPEPVTFVQTIGECLNGLQMLRPKKTKLDELANTSADDETKRQILEHLGKRISDGYTLTRWRAETGEETAAFSRGPLLPRRSPRQPNSGAADSETNYGAAPADDWAHSSNTGKEYQVLDTRVGIMDLTYSGAWSLGKSLAISDTSFSSALSRFRSFINTASQSKARRQANDQISNTELASSLARDLTVVDGLSMGDIAHIPRRIPQPVASRRTLRTAIDDEAIRKLLSDNIQRTVSRAAMAGSEIFNEFNIQGHNNSDWVIIHQWISEKLYLTSIPAHYLISDPSFLPDESMRFFQIDDVWMDCLIDGALSVANHLERDDDRVRAQIKQKYNEYLATEIRGTGVKPQIPGYGFILRSQIIKVMPDLRITVQWSSTDSASNDQRMPYCRYVRPDDHTILCLLDRQPEELEYIELAQPPHQQRFAFGRGLITPSNSSTGKFEFKFSIRELSTVQDQNGAVVSNADDFWPGLPEAEQPSTEEVRTWIEMGQPGETSASRIIDFATMATSINAKVRRHMAAAPDKPGYTDFQANSAELALELNDPSHYFRIYPDSSTQRQSSAPRNRQLWVPKVVPGDLGTGEEQPDQPGDSAPIGDPSQSFPPIPPVAGPLHPVTRDPPAAASKIVLREFPTIQVDPTGPPHTSQPQSIFDIKVYADYRGKPPRLWLDSNAFDKANYIATQNEYLYDLVFSVRKIPRFAKADLRLREIIINLPHSQIKAPAEPLIDAGSPTPKARILSNQRFVPFLRWTDEYLQIRLVPRSAEEHPVIRTNDLRTKQISFRLQEVRIPETRTKVPVPIHDGPREMLGVCKIKVYERYETPAGVISAFPAPKEIFLIKREVTDDNVVQY